VGGCGWLGRGTEEFNSKDALHNATETVRMSNNGKRLAWVTGGGSGIGEAGAEALEADGWTVVVSGRRKDALDAVVAKIAKAGGNAEAIALDVSKAADVNKAAEQILGRHGRIDLLVNSAGINVPKRSWADMELEGWNQLVDINLNGVLYCMRAVLPAMRKQKDGCIINVASWAGRHVSKMPGPAYTTTKHALLALTHSFNMDECVNGLRACCLSPGEVATPILKLRPVVPSEQEQARMLQSEDLGRTIAFVASMPPRVCVNEILISPTWNRGFVQTPNSRE
jgi:NADP-dependent 3-hydroxy acid dehydrogenase YdfG